MTRTTWRSICHARAVTIALSLVKQSMDLSCATRRLSPEPKILAARNGDAKDDILRIDEYLSRKRTRGKNCRSEHCTVKIVSLHANQFKKAMFMCMHIFRLISLNSVEKRF